MSVVAVPAKKFDGTTIVLNVPTYTDEILFAEGGLTIKGDAAPNGDGTGHFHRFEIDFTGGTLVVDNFGLARLVVGGFQFDLWTSNLGTSGRVDCYPIVQPAYTGATGFLAPDGGTQVAPPSNGS